MWTFQAGASLENKAIQRAGTGRLEDFLTRLYGNRYMELPPPEKRVTHQIRKLVV